jgi:hypothetical protein
MLCCPAFTCVLCCFCLPLPRLTLLVPANGWSSAPCLGMGLCPVWAGQACSGRPLVFHVSGPVWVTAVLVAAAHVTSIYLSCAPLRAQACGGLAAGMAADAGVPGLCGL